MTDRLELIKSRAPYGLEWPDIIWLITELERLRGALDDILFHHARIGDVIDTAVES